MAKSSITGTILKVVGAIVSYFFPPAGMAIMAAGAYVDTAYAKRRARDQYNSSLVDRYIMVATYNAERSRIYGRARNVDGIVFKGTHGGKSQFLTMVIALAGHEVDAIEDVYFDDDLVEIDDSTGAVTSSPYLIQDAEYTTETFEYPTSNVLTLSLTPVGDVLVTLTLSSSTGVTSTVIADVVSKTNLVLGGTVTYSTSAVPSGYTVTKAVVRYAYQLQTSYASVHKYLGTDSQDLSTYLATKFPDTINSTHKFSGIACLVVTFKYSEDVFPSSYPSVTAIIRGAKVYDPRTGVTAWSDNPALCIRDFALYSNGGSLDSDEVDDASIIASANACDMVVDYVESDGGIETRALYKCNYVAKLGTSPESHLGEMVESMGGKWGWAGGKLKIRPGVYQSPIVEMDESWLADAGGNRSLVSEYGMADVINTYRCTIADESDNWNQTQLAALSPSAYLTEDGVELASEIEMGAITYSAQALHVAGINLRDQRQGMQVVWPCNMSAWPYELFDTVNISSNRYGWDSKAFEIVGWQHNLTGGVTLTMKETGPSIYEMDAVFTAVDQIPNTNLTSPFLVSQMSGIFISDNLAAQGDGTVINVTTIEWDEINYQSVLSSGYIEVQWSVGSSDTWLSQKEAGNATYSKIVGLVDGETYFFRVRMATGLGVRGAWSNAVLHTVSGKSAPPSDISGLDADDEYISWIPVSDPDVAGYVLRWQNGENSEWESAQALHDGVITSTPYTWTIKPTGAVTILAKAIDTSGNYSLNAAVAYVTLSVYGVKNVVSTYSFSPTFPGTISSGSVSGGHLLADVTSIAYQEPARQAYGAADEDFYVATTYSGIEYMTSWWTPSGIQGDGILLENTISGAIGYQIDYQIDTGVFYGVSGATAYGDDADEFYSISAVEWLQWPGVVTYTVGAGYRWRIKTQSGSTQADISSLIGYVDGPDLEEIVPVTSISSSGTRLPLTKSYRSITSVVATIQAGSTAIAIEVQDMNASLGPLVLGLNSSRVAVNTSASALIKGY